MQRTRRSGGDSEVSGYGCKSVLFRAVRCILGVSLSAPPAGGADKLVYLACVEINILREVHAYARQPSGKDCDRSSGNQVRGRNGAVPVRRWLSRHAFPRRSPLATLRGSSSARRPENLERLGRFHHGRGARAELAPAQFRSHRLRSDFVPWVVAPIRALADETIDADAIFWGVALPGRVSDRVADAYDKHLFNGATLQDLPDTPRFVINATNVQSGALWRFMKPYMRDYRVGEVKNPRIPLAQAVAASSAFPPVLSPFEMRLDRQRIHAQFGPGSPAQALHDARVPHRRRRLRQSRSRDRLEALSRRCSSAMAVASSSRRRSPRAIGHATRIAS